jgi:protein SCO1/2
VKPVHIILGLVAMPIIAIAILGFTHAFETRELKPLGQVAAFELVDSQGKTVTNADFRNKVWIASFIFSSCSEQCPRINEAMQNLQKHLKSKTAVELVSISVDPVRDTPDVLSKYALRYGADPQKWKFLTGKPEDVRNLIVKSFKLTAGEPGAGSDEVIHSSRLALVDNMGTIRGYYDAMDKKQIHELLADAKSLLRGLY